MTPNSQGMAKLLAAIRSREAPKGYGQIYGGARGVPAGTDVSKMTLNQVLTLQRAMLAAGSKSTACGAYQFLRDTLQNTMATMHLTGSEVWDAALQDRMALQLMEGRGLSKYMAGQISRETFCNNLAMEWASLPVVTGPKAGASYYSGDGLNKSFHSVSEMLLLVDGLKVPETAAQPAAPSPAPHPGPVPAPPPPAAAPSAGGFWDWLRRTFNPATAPAADQAPADGLAFLETLASTHGDSKVSALKTELDGAVANVKAAMAAKDATIADLTAKLAATAGLADAEDTAAMKQAVTDLNALAPAPAADPAPATSNQ